MLRDNNKMVSAFTLPYFPSDIKSIAGTQHKFNMSAINEAIIICHSRKKNISLIFFAITCRRVKRGIIMGAITSKGNVDNSNILYAKLYSASFTSDTNSPTSIQSNLDIIEVNNTTPVWGRDSFINKKCRNLFHRSLNMP